MTKKLDSLNLPEDLRPLSVKELEEVVYELREELIDNVSQSGGHFASSLGATELTVALHHVFNTPQDKLIWDVGHQAYIHKMVTGRRDRMGSIRQKDGLSGFLRRDESEYDAFGAGHAGTSISAAVGMAQAFKAQGLDRNVIAIIGDGSMTAGMAFEALNHAGELQLGNLIVVLNDNEMSIAPNVGAISWLFSRAVTSKISTRARAKFKSLYRKGYIPDIVYRTIDRAEEFTQSWFSGPAMLFEAFGFRYIGPVDGHNVEDVVTSLRNAKEQDVPVLLHASTLKGHGYDPAETDPVKWHATKPFDRTIGAAPKSKQPSKPAPPAYTAVFAEALSKVADNDSDVVGITAAMPSGTGLDKFAKNHPDKFYDVGICEQHAVTFAAGLSCEGIKPVCAIYSTFLQRAYDQVVHDVCVQDLPVVFAMDRSGCVGNDGETHQGLFDIAYLRTLPNMVIMAPKDENELQHMLHTAVQHNGPIALRYPRGNGVGVALDENLHEIEIGKGEVIERGEDLLLICFGNMVQTGVTAAETLSEEYGLTTTIINARFAKPLDRELLVEELPKHKAVATLEDHVITGGFGSAVSELIQREGLHLQSELKCFGVADEFVPHGSQAEQHVMNGMDREAVITWAAEKLDRKKLKAAI